MAATAPDITLDDVTHALELALPEWRRHRRCGPKARCYAEHTEWVDILLEDMLERMPRLS